MLLKKKKKRPEEQCILGNQERKATQSPKKPLLLLKRCGGTTIDNKIPTWIYHFYLFIYQSTKTRASTEGNNSKNA